MEKLKPCPFCGSEAKTIVDLDHDLVSVELFVISTCVKCSKCGVYKQRFTDMKNASFEDFENVFAQTAFEWNNRV